MGIFLNDIIGYDRLKLKPNSITLADSELAPNRFGARSKLVRSLFRASSEPASVMEFGFYALKFVPAQ